MQANIRKIYFFSFFWMFMVIMPVLIPYFINLKLTMKEVFQLQAIFGLTVALLEVPSGYMSDLWSRRNTLILGSLFSGIGYTFLFWAKDFQSLAIYQVIIALSLSLVSGTDISLLYDSLGERKKDDEITAMANIEFSKLSAESIASIVGGFLIGFSFKAVLIGQAIAGWLPFIVVLSLQEPKRKKMKKHEHMKNFKKVFHFIFIKDKIVRLVFINSTIWGLATFFAVWMFQKYWLDENISLLNFGILWAIYNITVGIVGKQVPFIERKYGPLLLLALIGVCAILGYFGMAMSSGMIGIGLGLFFQISRGINSVLLGDALNKRTPSEFRATLNSVKSLFFRLGFFIAGPIIGYYIDAEGMRSVLIILGWVYIAFFIIFLLPLMIEVRKLKTWTNND